MQGRVSLALLAALFAMEGYGAPLYHVSAGVIARGNGATDLSHTGEIDGPVAAAGPVGFNGVTASNGMYMSSASSMAGYGHLSVSANAFQDVGGGFPLQSDALSAEQLGFSSTNFFDTITLTSASLPNGTAVDVFVNLAFAYSASAGPGVCCGVVGIFGQHSLGGGALNINISAFDGADLSGTALRQLHLAWQIGAANPIGAYIGFSAVSGPGSGGTGTSSISGDAVFTIEVDPRVTFSSASGAAYAAVDASVPEPATTGLAAVALTVLLAVRRGGIRA